MPVQSRSLFSERILYIELVYEPIFSALSPANLLRVSSTCRTAYAAVSAYTRVQFDVDRLLSRFFPSPTRGCSISCCIPHTHEQEEYARARAFRSLQARTGTLVSGSMALQFFLRTEWPESDLDLYVHMRHRREVAQWLLEEGYRYKPTDFQDPRPEVEIAECREEPERHLLHAWVDGYRDVCQAPSKGAARPVPCPSRRRTGEAEDDIPRELKVQVMVAKNTPMEVILGFHSTCVMNVISYEKAYCLFPQATLEERRTLLSSSCRGKGKHRLAGLAKYAARGFKILYDLPRHEVQPDPATPLYPAFLQPTGSDGDGERCTRLRVGADQSYLYAPLFPEPELSVLDPTRLATATGAPSPSPSPSLSRGQRTRTKPSFPLGWRWIDDSSSWVLPLPLTGVVPPPPANTATAPLAHDPVAVCNWEVRHLPGRGLVMHFEVAMGKILRYRYLMTDELLLGHLTRELGARVRVEEAKERLELEDWTYYDGELPALCRDFLHGLAERRMSSLRI